ncbi:hypothetical protein K1T71_007308 [Dendrolimus kikuchii]|uniref:Uncharacterized protein n=1 Tax=Dendrolimus kikuchii TaxID=765133 RepID=A0ACC1CZZ5_9NEOP|nr:hypothetical protein K1T71_007308 [Dendrolimus kikuchii]
MTSLFILKSMLFNKAFEKSKKKKKHKIHKAYLSNDINTSCRICNVQNGNVPIFDNDYIPNIPEEIHNFSGVSIEKTDRLSKYMCEDCLDLLNSCITFREMCQMTNKNMIEFADIDPSKKDMDYIEQDDRFSDNSYNIPSPIFQDQEFIICEICKDSFHSMKAYNKHGCKKSEPKIPQPKNKYLCDICGKTAFSNANLLVHMGTHENVFPFKCDACPYQGRTLDLLKVHKRTHMADKPYKCTQCPKATSTSSNLMKHMRHVHSNTRPFKCSYCDKAFSYQHDVNRHQKDTHLRQGTVECDICYKKFNTKKILQGHQRKIHKIKGDRLGRLPSYLQYQQMGEPNDTMNESERGYEMGVLSKTELIQ